jgi:hypothetical protein
MTDDSQIAAIKAHYQHRCDNLTNARDERQARLEAVKALADDLDNVTGARWIADALHVILDSTPAPAPYVDREALAKLLRDLTGLSSETWSQVSDVSDLELADHLLAAGWVRGPSGEGGEQGG